MNNRGQILFLDTGIVFYTHWHSEEIAKYVRDALILEEHWDDPEYLARLVFEQMLKTTEPTTGLGIGVNVIATIPTVIINCEKETISLNLSFRETIQYLQFCSSREEFTFKELLEEKWIL